MKTFKCIQSVPNNWTGRCKIIYDHSIRYYEDGVLHNETGPAIIHASDIKYWYYKGRNCGNAFNDECWIEKVKELKREDELKIFI